jgi:hypothetical protein
MALYLLIILKYMMVELQPVMNVLLGAVSAVAVYLFQQQQNHEKRIQKIEDVHAVKLDHLVNKVDKMELQNQELDKKITELSYNIHREKNSENALVQAINLLITTIDKDDK